MRIILLGAPGAGKGTQAKLICDKFNIPHISTGDIFRANIKSGTVLGKQAKSYIEKGELVPDDLTNSIVKERLKEEDCQSGFLLDGYPRNLLQAEKLDRVLAENNNFIEKVFYIDLSEQTVVERISGRRFCTACGHSYHLTFNPPRVKEICDICGNELTQREDDRRDIVIQRLKVYNQTINLILEYYSKLGNLYHIQGEDEINNIFSKISAILN